MPKGPKGAFPLAGKRGAISLEESPEEASGKSFGGRPNPRGYGGDSPSRLQLGGVSCGKKKGAPLREDIARRSGGDANALERGNREELGISTRGPCPE